MPIVQNKDQPAITYLISVPINLASSIMSGFLVKLATTILVVFLVVDTSALPNDGISQYPLPPWNLISQLSLLCEISHNCFSPDSLDQHFIII